MSSETSDSTTPTLPLPIVVCPASCGECIVKMSRTPRNPGRLFYCCPGDHHLRKSHGFIKWCEEADRGLLRVTEAVNMLTEAMSRLTDKVTVQGEILEAINNHTVALEHDITLHRQALLVYAFLISIQLVIILGQS